MRFADGDHAKNMLPMPLDMAWEEIVGSELGIIIIRAEDCLHCVELRAILSEQPLSAPMEWIDKQNATDLYSQYPLFAASVDILPFAGIFSDGELKQVVRAATRERIEDALSA
ncbi:MAG: hypothetical protein VX828_03815 [Candidatus Thermoplasmatota archaeon]|nr:hypothetical protein [Candidatus Thermoplasmatota archaeon]|tara:strand:+ start:397 stop:735 length:339 start_codon:yes stop_codon:yes gene_type:complete